VTSDQLVELLEVDLVATRAELATARADLRSALKLLGRSAREYMKAGDQIEFRRLQEAAE